MSYNGTVRCGWCGQTGHNRRGCPEFKKHVAKAAADGDRWAVDQLERKKRPSTRRCSWCGNKGHIADVHYIAEDPQHMRHVSRVIVNGMIMKILTPKDGKTQVYIPQVEMSLKNDTSPLLIGSQSWKAVQQTNAAMSVRSEIEVEPGTTVIGMTKFAQICDEAVKLIK